MKRVVCQRGSRPRLLDQRGASSVIATHCQTISSRARWRSSGCGGRERLRINSNRGQQPVRTRRAELATVGGGAAKEDRDGLRDGRNPPKRQEEDKGKRENPGSIVAGERRRAKLFLLRRFRK
ncbi:hypothetical protein L596_023792 [Steinernema carpocapsae]|uniref:Uncharacterized protein n=1 Tax=Steinernema carpocapsae TaxID=34508 RepID=A0A4U5MEQ0_STECR|nr:hypothetical protein L596_023792 [Steinernema carpocapsae]